MLLCACYETGEGLVLFILEQSADGQRDLLVLRVDVGDLRVHLLATLSQHVAGLLDAVVSDLRNVDQAVNAGDDLGKGAERS